MSGSRLAWVCFASALVTAVAGLATAAAEDGTTTTTSATYDAWVLNCQTTTTATATTKACGITTTVTVKDEASGREAVATVVTLRSKPKSEQIDISMQLPIIVWLPTGVSLRDAKDKNLAQLAFLACHGDACEAGGALTGAQLNDLRKAGDEIFALYRAQTGQNVKIGFGLKGFAAALDAMLKQIAAK